MHKIRLLTTYRLNNLGFVLFLSRYISKMSYADSDSKYNPVEATQFLRTVMLIASGLVVSYFFVQRTENKDPSLSKFDELLEIIEDRYVDTIRSTQIENRAVSNLLNNLDPHSIFISKEELDAANEPLNGNFSGVGIEFYIVQDTITVVSPIAGGPSELMGIKSGDKIWKINDTIVAGVKISNEAVFKKLRGIRGTKVKLSILRGQTALPPMVIQRDNIKVSSVEPAIMVDSMTGYIKINTFGENTDEEFTEQLTILKQNPKFQQLILDLRQNTGGYMEKAVAILDELISDNHLLVYTEGRKSRREEFRSKKNGLFESGKLAILIDEGSASASEILAGAVQDLDRGAIVGRRSFGKGLVQQQIPLSTGDAVRLTVAKYFTPSGRNIQKPYQGNEHYEEEIYDRYKNGEFFEEKKDSTVEAKQFYTLKGRKVKAGGGIYPDYFVALDTNYDYTNFSILRSLIPEYIYSHHTTFQNKVSSYPSLSAFLNTYQVSNDDLNAFYTYAKSKGTKWNTSRSASYENKLKSNIKSNIARYFYHSQGYLLSTASQDPVILKAKSILKTNPF